MRVNLQPRCRNRNKLVFSVTFVGTVIVLVGEMVWLVVFNCTHHISEPSVYQDLVVMCLVEWSVHIYECMCMCVCTIWIKFGRSMQFWDIYFVMFCGRVVCNSVKPFSWC